MERFLEWIKVKMRLHNAQRRPQFVSEGDIWWVGLGENIGTEANGKGPKFSRPVIILRKFSQKTFFVIPVSTQIHTGRWYVAYRHQDIKAVACLHQARTIDYRRLFSKLGELDREDFARVIIGFQYLYNLREYLPIKFVPPLRAGWRESPEMEQLAPLLTSHYIPSRVPVNRLGENGILSPMSSEEKNFIVEGGHQLSGSITTNRSKNGAVALLAASLLNKGTTTLQKVPKIEEVHRLVEVLRSIGVTAEWHDRDLVLTPPERISLETIDQAAATRTRSILMFIGPLIHHFKTFEIPQSGGCNFGTRTVRPHLWALEKFGVSIEALTDRFVISHTKLAPATIVMQESSDTATENALFAAARIPGTTVIKYASANYQVQEVCGFLRALGVQIEGVGSTTLSVTGISEINLDVKYTVAEDPTDAMFFLASAIVTKSSLTIKNAPIEFLELELSVLEKMNLTYTVTNAGLSENGITKLADIHVEPSSLIAYPERIHARPYPGLNIDNLPFFAVIATQAEGTTLIHDWTFEKRAIYYTELDRLGAETVLMDPHRIQIIGPSHLRGAELVCPPALRPATILLIGMLAAEGRSILRNVYSINRGYEDLVSRLESIGAHVEGIG